MSLRIKEKVNLSLFYRIISNGGIQVIALLTGILLARLLSPDVFGVLALSNTVIFYANNFTNFGFNNALVQAPKVNMSQINTVFTINIIISIFLFILTIFVAPYIAIFFNNDDLSSVLIVMSFYYIITAFYFTPVVILRREVEFKFLAMVQFFQALLSSLLALFFALKGFGYWAVVIASLASSSVGVFLLVGKTKWKPRFALYKDMGSIYRFGAFNFFRNQVELVVAKVDYLIVGKFLGLTALGIYEKSFELTDRGMSGVTRPIGSVFFSAFCRLKDTGSDEVRTFFLKGVSMMALYCYPVLFGMVAVAPHFVISCLGEQWSDAITPIKILSIACIFRVLNAHISNANVALGKYALQTFIVFLSAVIFIIFCFLFLSAGVVGISYAYVVYSIMSFLMSFIVLYVNMRISLIQFSIHMLPPFVVSAVMMILVKFLQNRFFVDYSSFFELVVLVILGSVFYVMVSACLVYKKIVYYKL